MILVPKSFVLLSYFTIKSQITEHVLNLIIRGQTSYEFLVGAFKTNNQTLEIINLNINRRSPYAQAFIN